MINAVMDILKQIETIHTRKNQDYSAPGKSFENFERAAILSGWFFNDIDKVFTNHIGTKLARLSTLLNSNKEPNNESVEDSFLDLCTYCILWYAYYKTVGKFLLKKE